MSITLFSPGRPAKFNTEDFWEIPPGGGEEIWIRSSKYWRIKILMWTCDVP